MKKYELYLGYSEDSEAIYGSHAYYNDIKGIFKGNVEFGPIPFTNSFKDNIRGIEKLYADTSDLFWSSKIGSADLDDILCESIETINNKRAGFRVGLYRFNGIRVYVIKRLVK